MQSVSAVSFVIGSYCECFAAGLYCVDSCACENCYNRTDYEDWVEDSREQIELRNPLAFAPTIVEQANDSPILAVVASKILLYL